MKTHFKRRNFFIKKAFQGRYIFQFYILITFGALIFSVVFSYLTTNTLSITYNNYHLRVDSTPLLLMKEMLTANWFIFIPLGLAVVVIGMFQTHRIAGPLFKLESILDRMTEGSIELDCRLRPNDDGQEVFQKLNTFNDFLASQLTSIGQNTNALTSQLNILEKHINEVENEELKISIKNLRSSVGEIQSTLDGFQIKK